MTTRNNNCTENKNTRSNKREAWFVIRIADNAIVSESFTRKKKAQAWLDAQHENYTLGLGCAEFADLENYKILKKQFEEPLHDVERKATQLDIFAHVETDSHVTPAQETATEKARRQAEEQDKREATRKAEQEARDRDNECTANFAAATMTINDTFRACNDHLDERIHEDGTTVGSYLAEYNLTKLNLKALKAILPAQFIDADGQVCMPTVKCATYDGVAEDDKAGKPVYYFVTSKRNGETKRTYKKAQTYGFSRITIWSTPVLLRLLKAAKAYPERMEHFAKRNAEVKAAKQFYIVNEVNDTAMSTKVADKSTRTTTYTRIDSANVKWAE